METLNIKDSDPTMFGSRMSTWFSKKQQVVTVSASEATEVATTTKEGDYDAKLSSSQYQEQDSSSTLSTGQSHHEGLLSPPKLQMQNATFQPGETCRRRGEDRVEPSLPCGNADCPSELEYNQSSDSASYFMPAPYSCNPNALVSYQISQMVGVAQARAVLPLDQAQGIPMFVNAKQYHAILRRRQTRAKLEAQNKAAKTRKPYLHESRHHHALRRARGSGGRFLNTKNLQQPTQKPETQHTESTSTNSGSEASCLFNNDYVFQQPDSRASISSLTTGVYSRMMAPNDLLMLSVERRAQIRSMT